MDGFSRTAYELFPSPKRVRVVLGGRIIADSRHTFLLRREKTPPVYYFPLEDVLEGLLQESGRSDNPSGLGETKYYHVRSNSCERPDGASTFIRPEGELSPLDRHIAFDWNAMDSWFEEDEEIFVHPRDPRTRIDIASSSAHVQVMLDGETVAESRRPTLLFETGLQTRYYLPRLDVRQEFLVPSEHISYCPYKGEAHYYSLRRGNRLLEDVIWYYRYPTLESSPIAGLLCFYQERITLKVDGRRV